MPFTTTERMDLGRALDTLPGARDVPGHLGPTSCQNVEALVAWIGAYARLVAEREEQAKPVRHLERRALVVLRGLDADLARVRDLLAQAENAEGVDPADWWSTS